MKFLPTVLCMAHMSPICSMMVAKAMGKMPITAVMSRCQSGFCATAHTVRLRSTGRPIQAASESFEKSTSPITAASM